MRLFYFCTLIISNLIGPLCGTAQGLAEPATVSLGIETKLPALAGPKAQYQKDHIIGEDASGYIYEKWTKGNVTIEHVDKNLQSDRSIKIKCGDYQGNEVSYQSATVLGTNLYAFYQSYDKKKQVTTLLACKLNLQLQKEEGNYIPLVQSGFQLGPTIEMIPYLSEYFSQYTMQVSAADSSLVVVAINHPYQKHPVNDSVPLRVYKFDFEMREVFRTTIPFTASHRFFGVTQIACSQEYIAVSGIEFFGFQEGPLERKGKRGKDSLYTHHLFTLKIGQDKRSYHEALVLEKQRICDIKIGFSPNEGLIVLGYYSSPRDNFPIGVLFMELDPSNLQTGQLTLTAFSDDFSDEYFFVEGATDNHRIRRTDSVEGSKRINWEMRFSDIVFHKDGTATLIGEEFKLYTFGSGTIAGGNSAVTGSQSYTSYADIRELGNNIHIIKFGPKGEVFWMKRIDKCQTQNSLGDFLSYSLMVSNDYFRIVFNDDIRNRANLRTLFICTGENSSYLRSVKINFSGVVESDSAVTTETGYGACIELSKVTKTNELLIWRRENSKNRLMKVAW